MGRRIQLDHRSTRRRAAAVMLCALSLLWACDREAREERFGLRLGMTPSEVRASVSVPGTFATDTGAADLVLTFSPDDRAETSFTDARFEFHNGVLVAVRASVPSSSPSAEGAAFEVTSNALTHRVTSDEGVRLHWISRHCPTHAAEVDRLLAHQPTKR